MRNRLPLALVLAAAASYPAAVCAQTIDTRTGLDRIAVHVINEELWAPGQRYVDSGGQTFVAPAARLDGFNFYLSTQSPPDIGPFRFRAYVYAWDRAAGRPALGSNPLWTSDTRIGSGDPTGWNGYAKFTFNTGGLALTPGEWYVALLSSIETPALINVGQWKGNGMALVYRNAYPEGAYVYGQVFQDGLTTAPLTSSNSWWAEYPIPTNAAFDAHFSDPTPTPEPMTMALVGSGLAALAAASRRRRT